MNTSAVAVVSSSQINPEQFYDMSSCFVKQMFDIIAKRRQSPLHKIYPVSSRPSDYEYCELHHIIPKSWYKTHKLQIDNTQSNVILLNIVEHIHVHYLLYKYFESIGDNDMANKMLFSIQRIGTGNKKLVTSSFEELLQSIMPIDEIERLKIMGAAIRSKRRGWHHTAETIEKIRQNRKGIVVSEESRKRISQAQIGKKHGPCPEERKRKISETEKKTKHREPTEAELQKLANRKLYGKHMIFINNGKIATRIYPNEPLPPGFTYGKLKNRKKWINDGHTQRQIGKDEDLPFGWKLGILPLSKEARDKIRQQLKGKRKSPETVLNMISAQRKRRQKEKKEKCLQ